MTTGGADLGAGTPPPEGTPPEEQEELEQKNRPKNVRFGLEKPDMTMSNTPGVGFTRTIEARKFIRGAKRWRREQRLPAHERMMRKLVHVFLKKKNLSGRTHPPLVYLSSCKQQFTVSCECVELHLNTIY